MVKDLNIFFSNGFFENWQQLKNITNKNSVFIKINFMWQTDDANGFFGKEKVSARSNNAKKKSNSQVIVLIQCVQQSFFQL